MKVCRACGRDGSLSMRTLMNTAGLLLPTLTIQMIRTDSERLFEGMGAALAVALALTQQNSTQWRPERSFRRARPVSD